MDSLKRARPLPDRTMSRGAHLVIETTRRAFDSVTPTTESRLQRLSAPVLLAPLMPIIFAIMAIALVLMVTVAAFVAAAIALAAVFLRRRVPDMHETRAGVFRDGASGVEPGLGHGSARLKGGSETERTEPTNEEGAAGP